MSMRICMVGNSHLAAMKSGWQLMSDEYSDIDIVMFGAPGSSFFTIDVRNGQIIADTSKAAESFEKTGGARAIEIDDFDAVVLVGGGLSLMDTIKTLSTHLPYELISDAFPASAILGARQRRKANWKSAKGIYRLARMAAIGLFVDRLPGQWKRQVQVQLAKRQVISDALFSAVLRETVAASHLGYLIRQLAEESDRPLYFIPTPRPSFSYVALHEGSVIARAHYTGWGEVIGQKTEQAFEDALDGLATVIRQPSETVYEALFTQKKYSSGSTRLLDDGDGHDEFDSFHMNEQYGALVLRLLIDRIRQDRTSEAASDRPHLT